MGQRVSSFPSRPIGFPFFSLSFVHYDTIVIVDASDQVISLIESVIARLLPCGIKRAGRDKCGAYEITLCGMPFTQRSSLEEAITIKQMLCELLEVLRNNGWELTLSSDLHEVHDLSTLFFQKVPIDGYDGCHILCLSLSGFDKLQLLNAPSEAGAILVEIVSSLYQSEKSIDKFFEVQMKGLLWSDHSSAGCFLARQILLKIFQRFHLLKYRYYGTANIKGTADCIFFIKDSYDLGQQEYCMLSLNSSDCIRLIGAPSEVVDKVGYCIQTYWNLGIQRAGPKGNGAYFEYKLSGYPWYGDVIDGFASRYLITLSLQELVTIGWAVVTSLDVSRRADAKAVFLLRRCTAARIPHFAICPLQSDKIGVVNATDDMIKVVDNAIRSYWTLGIQQQRDYNKVREYKLYGFPWVPNEEQFVLCRMMMIRLMSDLAKHGWRIICSADISARHRSRHGEAHNSQFMHQSSSEYSLDIHSWFIAYTGHCPSSSSSSSSSKPNAFTNNNNNNINNFSNEYLTPTAPPASSEAIAIPPPPPPLTSSSQTTTTDAPPPSYEDVMSGAAAAAAAATILSSSTTHSK